ncbi:MAG TPA: M23 family metallopeptidase [Candidatus Eisenbacteria bacterium]|nr:M23 family metallopeptidase [Candidatus Eisenbacteria bacterium]
MLRTVRCVFLAVLILASTFPARTALALGAQEVGSILSIRPLGEAEPLPGDDGLTHVAYELHVVNPSRFLVSIDLLEILDAGNGRTLGRLAGSALSAMTIMGGGEKGPVFGPSHSGYIYLDVVLPNEVLPSAIDHRFTISLQVRAAADDDHHGGPVPASVGLDSSLTFTGARVEIDRRPPAVIAPPLRGDHWLVANGCCDAVNPHRAAVIAIDGALYVPERFAIDFVQLDRDGKLLTGPVDKLTSYSYFGAPVFSVASGTVAAAHDGEPEEVPGAMPKGKTISTATGNYVIVDIGSRRYAVYAHFKTGSVRVRAGQHVAEGDVLGLVGNSGNTSNPHLHFHVSDRASPLSSVGLPYVFKRFEDQGIVSGLDAVIGGGAGTIQRAPQPGPHRNQLPLDNHVVGFGPTN